MKSIVQLNQEYIKIWLMDCENSSRIGLTILNRLDTMAAIAIIQIPSIYMVTGKSPNSYLCRPIIQATNVPTATPIKQEFKINTNDSYINILAILLFWYPKVNKIPISRLWLTMLIYEVVIREKKLINSTKTSNTLNILVSKLLIF